MGYYTMYKLEYQLPVDISEFESECAIHNIAIPEDILQFMVQQTELEQKLLARLRDNSWTYSMMDFVTGENESVKWYEWETDMRTLSAEFPTVLFTLHGEGENNHDMWIAYFLDGKMHRVEAKITYKPFNKNELQ